MADRPSFWVLGAGAWGTALAIVLARNKVSVTLWDHDQASIRSMQANGENSRYLPGIPFPDSLSVSEKMPEQLPRGTIVLVVVPSHAFRTVLKQWQTAGLLDCVGGVCWATKGLDSQHGVIGQLNTHIRLPLRTKDLRCVWALYGGIFKIDPLNRELLRWT